MGERFTDYGGDTISLCQRLLGQRLVRVVEGVRLSGMIVEVEAYLYPHDRACQTYGGHRSARNEAMYLAAGHAYVYFTYGMHEMLCVVSGEVEEGEAILIRAMEPREGLDFMYARRVKAKKDTDLCSGPGKLTQALAIDRGLNGVHLGDDESLFVEMGDEGQVKKGGIQRAKRVGIGDCGRWTDRLLRFYVKGNPHVSRR